MVGENWRYEDAFLQAKELIQETKSISKMLQALHDSLNDASRKPPTVNRQPFAANR